MSSRSCVACRTRRPRGELIRLSLDAGGKVVPDLGCARPGRGAWVCPTPGCLSVVEARPRMLGRALKREPPPAAAAGLVERVRGALNAELRELLRSVSAAGAVVSGARALAELSVEPVAFVVATDASSLAVAAARARAETAVCAQIGLDRRGLGALLGRGPRAVVAVLGGRPARELVLRLRWRWALG